MGAAAASILGGAAARVSSESGGSFGLNRTQRINPLLQQDDDLAWRKDKVGGKDKVVDDEWRCGRTALAAGGGGLATGKGGKG
ncbi:Os08g0109550 [Oryza sativa Japonica Group]|jgi:hypothetical protein|uniref:Os08g0109550 protein n=2 Tax=Oryza sativa subsp. japonica TaxID=39947 RepID=A3BBL6_ORYSJ|nr:hypothetical protein OsJ_21292 [Oryza sativa Japonica Group]BAT03488.1 Os08g0109550 [Oryza sativa Japonica Group]